MNRKQFVPVSGFSFVQTYWIPVTNTYHSGRINVALTIKYSIYALTLMLHQWNLHHPSSRPSRCSFSDVLLAIAHCNVLSLPDHVKTCKQKQSNCLQHEFLRSQQSEVEQSEDTDVPLTANPSGSINEVGRQITVECTNAGLSKQAFKQSVTI